MQTNKVHLIEPEPPIMLYLCAPTPIESLKLGRGEECIVSLNLHGAL